MFSFFKRFKSGGNKAAETSPESPESVESAALPETPESSVTPVESTAPKAEAAQAQPATVAPTAPTPPAATAATAPAAPPAPAAPAVVAQPASAAPVEAPRAPANPVENTAHSEPAPAHVPKLDAQAPLAAPDVPQVAPEPVAPAEPAPPAPAPVVVKDSHGEAIGEIVAAPAPAPAAKRSWLTRLKAGLSKTSAGLTGIFVGVKVDENLFEELEDALLMSDAGVEATRFLIEALRKKVKSERLTEGEQVKRALHDLLIDLLRPLEQSLVLGRDAPMVVMIAGVNGAGKTTSIGKLAKHFQHYNQSVLLAAGDTFRAAAREQLTIWGERNNVAVVSQESGDPAAVVFDAVNAARARKIDIVMADTAGRLPTQLHLMEELKKIKRVLAKAADGAPHEVLLVIDANTGQNALTQVKAFDDALQLTGLIVTKLDGTAKGGILAAIARQRPVPVYFIGVGEKVEDLQPFSAREFADALLG
ncbi:signal recognition particle-docking protein FtsY [Pandoraea apista]|uniref:Signal recognition particle receptor FtsY n=3 Tax=Pandoraea apista TaxID=93218 RepID=A0ABX9ZQE5_9BURK|nr:signal recognition particle-docking protein FtsY [Pandoraea apista]AJE98657.1 cell division protein FtsY [Pandoraea apista]AKH72726.1 cell division protein FtsY [Pandoraea apista]AKI61112.1 cell division protein FtsY [Pandoraea apista]AVF39307.1 signal recognition particle-docking protein FtsY [Pandoraea apista]PTE01588.1 signal recognition particle-docking protein FtsY [Pandoraea apista]